MFPEFQVCAPGSDDHVCVAAPLFVTVTVVPTGTVRVVGENMNSSTVNAAEPLAPAAEAPTTDVPTNGITIAETVNANLIQVRPVRIRRMVTAYGRRTDRVQPAGAQSEPPPGTGRCRTARAGVTVTVEPSTAAWPSTISE